MTPKKGNICVWDSERTLAYLLYNHFEDFIVACGDDTRDNIITGDNLHHNILELGTGMAGLAAVALGLRIGMERQKTPATPLKDRHISITLSDGNPNGVKNNMVNQYLTRSYSQLKPDHPYQFLDVTCKLLLWSTEMPLTGEDDETNNRSDIILVSDCTHFQNFHAALAITMIRCLKVKGAAIFCQPTRGDSLDNFVQLLNSSSSSVTEHGPLVSCRWWSHPVIEQKHQESISKYKDIYDESLHRPKILLVTKARDMTEEDRLEFMVQQKARAPSLCSKIREY